MDNSVSITDGNEMLMGVEVIDAPTAVVMLEKPDVAMRVIGICVQRVLSFVNGLARPPVSVAFLTYPKAA